MLSRFHRGGTRLAALLAVFAALLAPDPALSAFHPARIRAYRGGPRLSAPGPVRLSFAAALSADAPGAAASQDGLPTLRDAFERAVERARAEDEAHGTGRLGGIFDGVRPQIAGFTADSPASPVLPAGIQSVSVRIVRTAADIEELVPRHENSIHLIQRLKESLGRMAPYRVYTHHDASGGVITAIDLSASPGLVDILPDQYTHERVLIKKIQAWTKDIQVIVFEEGPTPDLIVAGTVTELKSVVEPEGRPSNSVKKANGQVRDHKRRHGLGNGAVAVHLTLKSEVPVAEVLAELEAWRSAEREFGGEIALDKIFVFAGDDFKVFVRLPDGSFGLQPSVPSPFTPIRSASGS